MIKYSFWQEMDIFYIIYAKKDIWRILIIYMYQEEACC